MIRGEGMSTTEDYLDQLLKNASNEGNDDIGETDSELQSEESIISLEDSTDEMSEEDGISLEQAMEMSVDDVLNEMEYMDTDSEQEEPAEEELTEEPELEILGVADEPILETNQTIDSQDIEGEMVSDEDIAAIFAEDESSLDDMFSNINEDEIGEIPEEIPIVSEDIGTDSVEESSGDDSILDLLNMMSDDEDLKDIGDLLKADEVSEFDMPEDEVFDEVATEGEKVQQEEVKEKEKSEGLFSKLFGKKKDKAETDENQLIIKEVEQEIEEEDKKKEEKAEKKKKEKKEKKRKKKEKNNTEKQEEGEESEEGKKAKKDKKKKVKKEKSLKEAEGMPKEPPLPKKPVILIMLMAASILALVLLSYNLINYQASISKADNSFINRNYAEAYENIVGVKVKEDDKQLYDRIRVMMKLEGKYKMYLLHIEQNQYDEALNDLIMGVVKYEQYKKDAEALGIQQAFDDELALIEEQMNHVFGVDTEQAKEWHNTLSTLDYTETIRSVVKAAGYSVEEPEESLEEGTEDLSQFGVEEVE